MPRPLFRDTRPRIVKPKPARIRLPGSGTGDPGSGAVVGPNVKVVMMELATMVKSCPLATGEMFKVIRLVPVRHRPPVW